MEFLSTQGKSVFFSNEIQGKRSCLCKNSGKNLYIILPEPCSWKNQGIFLYSIFPEHIWKYSQEFHMELFPNILGIYHGNDPRIFHEQHYWNIIWEYSLEFHREPFPNIQGIYHGNVLRIFY